MSAFAWKLVVGFWFGLLLSGGSWGTSGGLPAFFLAHLEIRQRAPVLVSFFETSARNSLHALVESWLIWFLI